MAKAEITKAETLKWKWVSHVLIPFYVFALQLHEERGQAAVA